MLPDGIQGMWNTLRDTGMELLAWPAPHYFYPNVRGINSQITIFRDKGIKIIDSRKFLCRQAKDFVIQVTVMSMLCKRLASTT